MTLLFEDETREEFSFSPERQAEVLIRTVCEYFRCPNEVEVNLLLVAGDTIQELNKEHRNIDRPTDVLSFPMSEFGEPGNWSDRLFEQTKSISPETDELLLGDIVLCSSVVKQQAEEYGHSELREFSFLIVHSLLHLMGFDHMEEDERIEMEERQKEIMRICDINRV